MDDRMRREIRAAGGHAPPRPVNPPDLPRPRVVPPSPVDLADRLRARAERAERELAEMRAREELRSAGLRLVLDAAAVAVLLADSQRQLAMTWGAELAHTLEIERRCHAIEERNLRAGIIGEMVTVRSDLSEEARAAALEALRQMSDDCWMAIVGPEELLR